MTIPVTVSIHTEYQVIIPPQVRTMRKIGDPIMVAYGYDGIFENFNTASNFQAIDLYNKSTFFGGISNFLRIPQSDLKRIMAIQVQDEYTPSGKMDWLCHEKGSVLFDAKNWIDVDYARWGTLCLGRYVWVEGYETFPARLPKHGSTKINTEFARLRGFRKDDWDLLLNANMSKRADFDKQLKRLVAYGLIHEVWCTYHNGQDTSNRTPKGVIYLPFFSPADWILRGPATPQVQNLYCLAEWLE